jgi:hypothetical protein
LIVHDVSDVRQIEIHTAEPLVPGRSHLYVEIAIAKLKKYKSPGSDQIPAELYPARGEILVSVIHKLIISVCCIWPSACRISQQLYKWKNYFFKSLYVHNVSDVRQIEIHTAESLIPRPSRL